MLLNSIKLFKDTMAEALDNKFTHKIEDSIGNELVDDALGLHVAGRTRVMTKSDPTGQMNVG